jgi:hypothetical protein
VPFLHRRVLAVAIALVAFGLVALAAFSASGPAADGQLLASPTETAAPRSGGPLASGGSQVAAAASQPASEIVRATLSPATWTPAASTPLPATLAPTAAPKTPSPTAAPTPAPAACRVFPATNAWNRDISTLPVASDSATLIASIGLTASLHPDFSATGYGIPINVVGSSTPRVSVSFQYADESDPGPYPIPANPVIEGGSDRHLILWDKAGCDLYELFAAKHGSGGWSAGSGAIWDLTSNVLRPDGWTSADAAGLPILPGLARYDEVAAGVIRHALRFTAPQTRSAHIFPARHDAGAGSSAALPPMGLRVRLKASVDLSGFGTQARVILEALKRYGMILADNGSPWYVTGAPDPRWDDDQLHAFGQLTGADFEVVDTSTMH